MRKIRFLSLFVLAAVSLAAAPIRVTLLTGGHDYERAPYLQIYAANPDIVLTHLEHTAGTADGWDRIDLATCDVVVLYDMPRTITPAQQAKFKELFQRGIGLVVTHHALVSYADWPEYERIIGGRWLDPKKSGDPAVKAPGYRHDVDLSVVVTRRAHPVTAGVENFQIRDEIYWGFRTGEDITPLLTTPHHDSGNPLAWVRTEGKSRVVYLQLGHGPSAYADLNYRRLLANAIRWTAGR